MEKVKVSPEIAEALDKLDQDKYTKQFNLIAHCKGYSATASYLETSMLKSLRYWRIYSL